MRGLDDTDRRILSLLLADARRPYSDIADEVGLSAPAVSDRVDRLETEGLIRRFTLELDRELLTGGTPVLVTIEAVPGAGRPLQTDIVDADAVEHVFRTADDRLVVTATVEDPGETVGEWVDPDRVRSYDVTPLAGADWTPQVGGTDLARTCDECDNTVTSEGETATLDGDAYQFCCESCRAAFADRYRRLSEGA